MNKKLILLPLALLCLSAKTQVFAAHALESESSSDFFTPEESNMLNKHLGVKYKEFPFFTRKPVAEVAMKREYMTRDFVYAEKTGFVFSRDEWVLELTMMAKLKYISSFSIEGTAEVRMLLKTAINFNNHHNEDEKVYWWN